MNLKKPKFWDYKQPNIYAYLLLPIAFFLKIWSLLKITEKEYIEKYGQPFEFDSKKNDIEIIDLDNIKSNDKR